MYNYPQASNFDSEFTGKDPTLTPPDQKAIAKIEQALFKEFSFVNTGFGTFKDASATAGNTPLLY